MLNFKLVEQDWGVAATFEEAGWNEVESIAEADALVFPGGADISPCLYGETPEPHTYSNVGRDLPLVVDYMRGQDLSLMMIGICRGGQFLNVMNGGSMVQHIKKHTGDHFMYRFDDKERENPIRTSSLHHQMMILNKEKGVILYWANELDNKDEIEPEVIWYPRTKSICYQGHPEYGPQECTDNFFEVLNETILKE